jgi:hypothetical protein
VSIIDPLDGLESRPIDTQVGVLANEVRNQRNLLLETRAVVAGVQKALWYLIATIVVGIIVFVVTTTLHTPHVTNPTGTSQSTP